MDSNEVAALQGAIEGVLDGEPLTLAMLQDFAANSADGWSMALASVRDLLAEADLRADEVGGDFAGEASRLGETVAVVHDELRRALGETSRDARELAAVWHQRLGGTVAEVPALAPHVDAIRDTYDAVAGLRRRLPTQRVHGDLHLGQTLRTPRGWLLIDFEGEPAAPLAERVRPDSALRDVGGHAALVRLRGVPPDPGQREPSAFDDADHDSQLAWRANEWAERNRSAFCEGYALRAGTDPRDQRAPAGRSSWTRPSTSCCTRPAAARPGRRSRWPPSPASPRSRRGPRSLTAPPGAAASARPDAPAERPADLVAPARGRRAR